MNYASLFESDDPLSDFTNEPSFLSSEKTRESTEYDKGGDNSEEIDDIFSKMVLDQRKEDKPLNQKSTTNHTSSIEDPLSSTL